jgi:hypothetical protein
MSIDFVCANLKNDNATIKLPQTTEIYPVLQQNLFTDAYAVSLLTQQAVFENDKKQLELIVRSGSDCKSSEDFFKNYNLYQMVAEPGVNYEIKLFFAQPSTDDLLIQDLKNLYIYMMNNNYVSIDQLYQKNLFANVDSKPVAKRILHLKPMLIMGSQLLQKSFILSWCSFFYYYFFNRQVYTEFFNTNLNERFDFYAYR